MMTAVPDFRPPPISMSDRHITLFVPGLFGPEVVRHTRGAADELAVAQLERWLSRGERRSGAKGTMETLCALFGITTDADHDPPLAEVTRVADGLSEGGVWLRADPVNLRPDRDRLVMFDNRDLLVRVEEAQQLTREFNEVFQGDGMTLFAPNPLRWYLRLEQRPQLRTCNLCDVVGQDVHPHLPQGPQALAWHRLLNEIQMLFHGSEVNRRRRDEGKPEINSLWFWGGGELSEQRLVSWQRVWTNEPLSQAFASYVNAKVESLPATAAEWLELSTDDEQHLVVFDGAIRAWQFGDIERWRNFMESFVGEWVQDLTSALRERRLAKIRLVTDVGFEWLITVANQRRWWRRHRRLLSYVS